MRKNIVSLTIILLLSCFLALMLICSSSAAGLDTPNEGENPTGNKSEEAPRYIPEYEVCGNVYWSLSNGTTVPAKCVKVQLLSAGSVLTTAYTNENGHYSFGGPYLESFSASIKILAENAYTKILNSNGTSFNSALSKTSSIPYFNN